MKLTLAALVFAFGCCAQTRTLSQYLDKQIADTESQLTILRQAYKETYPGIRNLQEELSKLRARREALTGKAEDTQALVRELDGEIAFVETLLGSMHEIYKPQYPGFTKWENQLERLRALRAAIPKQ